MIWNISFNEMKSQNVVTKMLDIASSGPFSNMA